MLSLCWFNVRWHRRRRASIKPIEIQGLAAAAVVQQYIQLYNFNSCTILSLFYIYTVEGDHSYVITCDARINAQLRVKVKWTLYWFTMFTFGQRRKTVDYY